MRSNPFQKQIKVSLLILIFYLFFYTQVRGQQQYNVLLIMSDDLNTRIGPYMDIEKHTPNLTRLAHEGIQFTHAYCQYPLSGPSRASLMSGLYPETNGVLKNQHVVGSYRGTTPELSDHPTIAGFFRKQGYYSARVSKIFHMGVPGGIERGAAGDDDPDSWDYAYNVLGPETQSQGNLELLSPGNLHYGSNFSRMIIKDEYQYTQTDYVATNQAIAILENRAGEVAKNARNKVKHKPEAPFFLAVGMVRPHVPFIAPENCFEPYETKEMQLPDIVINDNVPEEALRRQNENIWEMNNWQQKQTIGAYMASVRFMDQQVGRLLDALERLDLRDETIVVFVSDHGYNLGEHNCWSKVSLWEGSVRVPLIISYPGNTSKHGTTCNMITELVDLYPTLTGLCGISDNQPGILQGKSFAAYIKNNQTINEEAAAYTVSYDGNAASVRTSRWRYTRWGNKVESGNEELYDHNNDPEELINLVDDPDYKAHLKKMRKKLKSFRKKAAKQ